MKNFKKILLPVDGSKSSLLAKKNAIAMASAMDADLLLLYVADTIPAFITGQPKEEAIRAQQEEADQILAPYRQFLLEHKVNHDERITPGANAGDTICKIAREERCDLIVMGSRGLGEWEGAMVGSVTNRVLAQCGIPVLVVR